MDIYSFNKGETQESLLLLFCCHFRAQKWDIHQLFYLVLSVVLIHMICTVVQPVSGHSSFLSNVLVLYRSFFVETRDSLTL